MSFLSFTDKVKLFLACASVNNLYNRPINQSFPLTRRLQAVHPVQTVWLAIPITSEFVQEQHIFWAHSVP